MSTSAHNPEESRLTRWLITGTGASAFLALFNLVYTALSYGESSPHMKWAFLFPLVLCAVPAALLLAAREAFRIPRPAFNLWNGGVATLVCGNLLRGAVDIAGRSTELDACYYLLGTALLIAALAVAAAAELYRAGRNGKGRV